MKVLFTFLFLNSPNFYRKWPHFVFLTRKHQLTNTLSHVCFEKMSKKLRIHTRLASLGPVLFLNKQNKKSPWIPKAFQILESASQRNAVKKIKKLFLNKRGLMYSFRLRVNHLMFLLCACCKSWLSSIWAIQSQNSSYNYHVKGRQYDQIVTLFTLYNTFTECPRQIWTFIVLLWESGFGLDNL